MHRLIGLMTATPREVRMRLLRASAGAVETYSNGEIE